jgi:hypothetical protein
VSATWDPLRTALLPRLRDVMGDAWNHPGVAQFAQMKLDEMAKDAWFAVNGDSEQVREVHRDNLEDLWAHVKDETLIASRNTASGFGELLGEALGLALKTAAGILLGAIEAKFGGLLS